MKNKHLAILMTNTDESDFAQKHPKDGHKFSDLIHLVRPDWTLEVFAVKDGVFPEDLSRFDGVMITGSPASVRNAANWVAQLLGLIRELVRMRKPLFGACFGHQAIALALGGEIGRNPGGWVHGLTRNKTLARPGWTADLPQEVKLYGSHVEQVARPPDGAVILSRGPDCPITGFAIGRHVFTTQHHPEMSHGFILALTDEMQKELGPEIYQSARDSLRQKSDQLAYAESIARFFEQAE